MATHDPSEVSLVTNEGLRSIRLTGHKMLLRKCLRNDNLLLLDGGKGTKSAHVSPEQLIEADRIADQIVGGLPCYWCEVLAVGPLCNTTRSRQERKRHKIPQSFYNPSQPGDFVVLPEVSERSLMWRGVFGNPNDLIVDECELIAIVKQADA